MKRDCTTVQVISVPQLERYKPATNLRLDEVLTAEMITSLQKGKNPFSLFPQQNIQNSLFYTATSLTPKSLDSKNNDAGLRR